VPLRRGRYNREGLDPKKSLARRGRKETMSEEEGTNGGHGFAWFVIGMIFGVAGALLAPRWAAPYLPDFLGGAMQVEGEVLEKLSEPDRILVKVSTPEGLILAAFTQNLKELDLLIEEGDSITLALDEYETLVANPPVERVVGSAADGDPVEPVPPAPVGETEETAREEGEDAPEAGPAEPGEPEPEDPTGEQPPGEETTEPEVEPDPSEAQDDEPNGAGEQTR